MTASERETAGFLVERAGRPRGPFAVVAGPVRSRGPGYRYRILERLDDPVMTPWYRVVELTFGGRGDVSRVVRAQCALSDRQRHPRIR